MLSGEMGVYLWAEVNSHYVLLSFMISFPFVPGETEAKA
jgi:hypothetical protein